MLSAEQIRFMVESVRTDQEALGAILILVGKGPSAGGNVTLIAQIPPGVNLGKFLHEMSLQIDFGLGVKVPL